MSGPLSDAGTAGGYLLVLSLVVPVAAVLLAFVAGGRHVARVALAVMPVGLAITGAILVAYSSAEAPIVYRLGGWSPPLGDALRADGLSAVMTATTALVVCERSVARSR